MLRTMRRIALEAVINSIENCFFFTQSRTICHVARIRPISIVCSGKNQLLAPKPIILCLNQFSFLFSDRLLRLHFVCVSLRTAMGSLSNDDEYVEPIKRQAILTMNICDNCSNQMMNNRCIGVTDFFLNF